MSNIKDIVIKESEHMKNNGKEIWTKLERGKVTVVLTDTYT